jgi:hypothetical protein
MGMADPHGSDLYSEIAILLRQVAAPDAEWPADLGPATRLDGDLLLDSVEVAAFSTILSQRYGDRVDLLAHLAGLSIDEIIALTIADVAGLVAAQHRPAEAGGR